MRFTTAAMVLASAVGCSPQEGARPLDDRTEGLAQLSNLEPAFFDTEGAYAADEIALVRSPFDAPLLRGRNCDVVSSQIAALRSLSRRFDPAFDMGVSVSTRIRPSGWCEANVASVMPPYLQQTLWKRIDDTSVDVNCWGHALRTVRALPGLASLPAAAFTQVLSSSQCRLIPKDESPRPGDLVAIRSVSRAPDGFFFQEVHGAVWLSDKLWITKNGASRFAIEPPRRVLDAYVLEPRKQECRERSPDRLSAALLDSCRGLVQVFRCETFDEFMAPQAIGADVRRLVSASVPFLGERIHQQRAMVDAGDLHPGETYFSSQPFNYVKLAYEELDQEMPRVVRNALRGLRSDAFLVREVASVEGLLAPLPADFHRELRDLFPQGASLASGDGFVLFMDWVARRHRALHDRLVLDSSLSPAEREVLFTMLFALAGSDGRFEEYDNYWISSRMPFSQKILVSP